MSLPDFDRMTKDQVVGWFRSAPEPDLVALVRTSRPVGPPSAPGRPGDPPTTGDRRPSTRD